MRIVMASISDLLPVIMKNKELLFSRFHNFEHANLALIEEVGEGNYELVSKFLSNEDKNWFNPYPKTWKLEGSKENDYNWETAQSRLRIDNKIENWVLNDYEFYLSEFMEIIKDKNYTAEEFMECVDKSSMWCTIDGAPGGVYYTPIQWLSVLMKHDNYSDTVAQRSADKIVDTELVDFLMFKDSYYNEDCTNEELIKSEMFNDIFKRDDFAYDILIGAFKFNFVTYECSYLKYDGNGIEDWLPCGYQYLKKNPTP